MQKNLPHDYNQWHQLANSLGIKPNNNTKPKLGNNANTLKVAYYNNSNATFTGQNLHNTLQNNFAVTPTYYQLAMVNSNHTALQKSVNIASKTEIKKFVVQQTIDLHNHTIEQAKEEIFDFLLYCYTWQIKKVLVITGKGSNSQNKYNTIKSNFLDWLVYPEITAYVHAYAVAQKQHGGEGAFYLWIRSKKK